MKTSESGWEELPERELLYQTHDKFQRTALFRRLGEHLETKEKPKTLTEIAVRTKLFFDSRPKFRAELANVLQVTPGALTHWVTDGNLPAIQAVKLAKIYGLSLNWLYLGRGPMYLPERIIDLFPDATENDMKVIRSLIVAITGREPEVGISQLEGEGVGEELYFLGSEDEKRRLKEAWKIRDAFTIPQQK